MAPLLILVILGISILLGPAAFILLWLVRRRTGEESLGLLALSVLGLCLIMLGNGASLVLEGFLGISDARLSFIALNWVFLSTVASAGFFARFACSCVGAPVTSALRALFWAFTVAFFFLVISLPIFIGRDFDMSRGYLASTCYGTIVQAWASVLVLRRRSRIPPIYGKALPGLIAGLMVLGLASVANDALKLGELLGGAMFPFSPFFFILVSGSAIAFCVRELLDATAAGSSAPGPASGPARGPADGLGALELSAREKEVLPLMLEGLSNEDIAERLFISPHTVKNHVTSIFRKARVANRYELLARAGGEAGRGNGR
jgi:DNA-binding CsgD family transcriptional regulator